MAMSGSLHKLFSRSSPKEEVISFFKQSVFKQVILFKIEIENTDLKIPFRKRHSTPKNDC